MGSVAQKSLKSVAYGLVMVFSCVAVGAPKIASPQPEFQFGEMESGLNVDATFVIRNDGDQPLQIEKVVPGCGCTRAKLSQNTIPPGGNAQLTAVLSLREQRGDQRKQVTLYSNDPETPIYNLYMVGKAVLPIAVTPEKLHFGEIDAHAGPTKTIDLKASTPEKAFQITRLEPSDPNAISARFEEVEKDKHYRVHVTFSKQMTPGDFRGFVRMYTSNRQFSVIGAGITATVAGEVAVSPSEIRILNPRDKAGKSVNIAVTPGKVGSFKVTGVDSPAPSIRTTIMPMGGSIYRIKVEGLTPEKDFDGKAVVIKTDIKEMPEIRIPLRVLNEGHAPITTQPAKRPGTPAQPLKAAAD